MLLGHHRQDCFTLSGITAVFDSILLYRIHREGTADLAVNRRKHIELIYRLALRNRNGDHLSQQDYLFGTKQVITPLFLSLDPP